MWSHGVLSHLTADLGLPLQVGPYKLDSMPFTTGIRESAMETSAPSFYDETYDYLPSSAPPMRREEVPRRAAHTSSTVGRNGRTSST